MHYRKHIFCCVNERPASHPRSCCAARGSAKLRTYMKKRARELGLHDIRVNNAGCLERCELGPTMVIYPQGHWYHYASASDIDEILQRDIIEDQHVERLLLKDGQKYPSAAGFLRLQLKVAAIARMTAATLRIEFVDAKGGSLPEFTAGSHVDLQIGEPLVRRSYSLANSSQETHRYVIGVLHEQDGRGGSQWLHETLRVGDVVQASYPSNNFELNESAASYLLIAGGIGVAPILSMCYRLRQINAEFSVHYCARSKQSAPFLEPLQAVCGDRLRLHFDDGEPDRWLDFTPVVRDCRDGTHLYVCGPSGLMDAALAQCSHWPDAAKHCEVFHGAAQQNLENNEFRVLLARRQQTIQVSANQSILDALRASDVVPDFACAEGLCGACRTAVLHGQVDHRDAVLSEPEKRRQNQMMICVSRAAKGETQLILDL